MIATDVNNPDFAGAYHPDARLSVQFYSVLVRNEFESEKQQRSICAPVDYVRIMVPGDKLSVIETPVRPEHKNRFARQWAAYQNRKDGDTHLMGTPITDWPRITPVQAEELRSLKFFTVEAVANASDAQLQGIGMIAGVSAYSFRDEAKRFLSVADAAAKLSEADKRVQEANDRIAQMERDTNAKLADMMARMDALLALKEAESKQDESTVEAKRGPGRPRQAEAA